MDVRCIDMGSDLLNLPEAFPIVPSPFVVDELSCSALVPSAPVFEVY